jgi:hypothetical protein
MDKPETKSEPSANQLQTDPPPQTTVSHGPSSTSNRLALYSVYAIFLGLASFFLMLVIDLSSIPLGSLPFLFYFLIWSSILFIFALAPILALIAFGLSFRQSSKTVKGSSEPIATATPAKAKNQSMFPNFESA